MTATDLRALERLGQLGGRPGRRRRRRLATRPVRGVPAATARRRVPRPLLALAVVTLATLGYLGFTAAQESGADGESALRATSQLLEPRRETAGDRPSRSRSAAAVGAPRSGAVAALAEADGLTVMLPHENPVLVAFHEASMPEALELVPVGRLAGNDNPTKFNGGLEAQEPPYRVLSSRGRPRPATSAVDVVVAKGATVTAPITGTVVEARRYALYGSTRDWRVVIAARERPELQVVLIHLHRPSVRPGEEVVAGRTPIAVARSLPFTSQVDYVVGESLPHVHLEVKAATVPKPVDPNAPAVEPHDALDVGSR